MCEPCKNDCHAKDMQAMVLQIDSLTQTLQMKNGQCEDMIRLNGELKAVVQMVVDNKPLWKIQSAAVDALGKCAEKR